MKFNISKIASLIKKSNHSRYEKLKIQLFFEWSLFRGFVNLDKGYLELTHQEIENIIKNPNSYYLKGIIPLNNEFNYSSAISKPFKILIKKIFRKFIIIFRFINSYFIISNSFIEFFYKKVILKKNIKFIFESNKCKHLWKEYSNVIFFSLEDINNLTNVKTNKLINWKLKTKSNDSYKFKIEDIAYGGFLASILNLLNSKKINYEIKTYKLNFPIYIINKIIIIKLLKFCFRKAKNIFFIDNSQGLLIKSKCLEEFINLKKSRIYNNQHGGGYFELDREDFLLAELSPAYDKPLIGIYRSNLIRTNYPINGKNYSLRNKNIKNSILIIEGADPIKKNISKKIKKPKNLFKIYSDLINIFAKNNIKCFIKKHPRSNSNLNLYHRDIFIEAKDNIPIKYIPNKKDFRLIFLIGFGQTLLYSLLQSGANVCVIADESDYKISKSGRKHIKFLKGNNLLISPQEIFKFESLEFLMNFNQNNRNIDFSKLINNEAKNFEKWLIEHF